MKDLKFVIGVGLAAATLVLCFVNAVGNVALITKVGPTPVLSLVSIVLASAAFIVSWKIRSYLVAGLLAAGGIIFMVPALNAMGYSFEVIIFPGPILGIIFGLAILGLGMTIGIRSARTITAPVPSQ
jgi:hypothetical protein